METEIYLSLAGDEMIAIYNEDGSVTSMLKAVWDELEAAKEASGTLS